MSTSPRRLQLALGLSSPSSSVHRSSAVSVTSSPSASSSAGAGSPSSSTASFGGGGQAAALAVLKSQLRLERHRTAELESKLQQLRDQIADPAEAATEEALRACELQLRNERKRRSAAETAAKLAKGEAFKFKKALSETREDAQERVNGTERRWVGCWVGNPSRQRCANSSWA